MLDVSKFVSAEVLTLAKQKLHDKTAAWNGGVCSGMCIDLEGKETLGASHTACHSWVGYAYAYIKTGGKNLYGTAWDAAYPKDAKNFLTLTCHSPRRSQNICDAEAVEGIIKWFAHESPWSEYFLNKDDEKSLLNDGAILFCGPDGLSHAEAMWICKVMRYSVEGSKSLESWLTLYKAGVNPVLAVLVCTYVQPVKGATFGYSGVDGHVSVFGQYNGPAPDLASIMEMKINKNAPTTGAVFACGGKPIPTKIHKGSPTEIIKGFCKPVTKDDGWGGKVAGAGADINEFTQRVLAWQAELMGEAVPEPVVVEKAAKPAAKKPGKNTVFLEMDM